MARKGRAGRRSGRDKDRAQMERLAQETERRERSRKAVVSEVLRSQRE